MDIYMIISSLVAGVLGSMGFGGGSVLIIYLVTFLEYSQKRAQGINLIFFIPCALISVITYAKSHLISLKQTLSVTVPAIFGAIIGFFVLDYVPTEVLSKVFGLFLLCLGTVQLFSKNGMNERP